MLRIAVFDDEPQYLNYAEKIINENFSNADTNVYTFSNKEDFDKLFNTDAFFFDIIIADIQMADIDGIELAKYIRKQNERIRIIFLTNYLEYATDVYDTDHTFFVLKNEAETRLPVALNKAIMQLERMQKEIIALDTIHNGKVFFKIDDILYFERISRETIIHTEHGEETVFWNLDKLENMFKKNTMARVHRSYMINMHHIKKLRGNDVIMSDSSIIHITRSYSKKFKEDFMNFIKS